MDLVAQIMREAELELTKEANDNNGAPEQKPENGGQDIMQLANNFLAKVEQFKTSLGDAAASQGGEVNEEVPVDDPNQPQDAAGGATIQTPGGTVIKLASLVKLASLKPSLFAEA